MDKNKRQQNIIILMIIISVMIVLFGIGFLRIGGRSLPQQKKSILPGIAKIINTQLNDKK
ncbi:MAG: hypothetical protein COY39_00530 [Alphaproteobacteria bacterium CG_4_10_14_0_8_um_filter_37_21]|nr:MAG: hypothetical protein COY39_00530 [Alphaproteobacteria bacterium CG_4_10_14_0_8_um_filter_37_21]